MANRSLKKELDAFADVLIENHGYAYALGYIQSMLVLEIEKFIPKAKLKQIFDLIEERAEEEKLRVPSKRM